MSYYETTNTNCFSDYIPDNDQYSHETRKHFTNNINLWLKTERGIMAKRVLSAIEQTLSKYKFNNKYQLKEDIIYLMYKSQNDLD